MLYILEWPFLANRVLVPEDENLRVLPEEPINVLQGPTCRLRVEEVDNRHESSVENRPDDVEPPMQGLNADWGDFDHHEVACPIRSGAEGRPLGTHREGVDLSGVEPGTPCQPMPKKM